MPERKSKNALPEELELSLEKLSLENNSTEKSASKKRAPKRRTPNKDTGEKSSLEKPSPKNSAHQISAPKKRAYKRRASEKRPAWSMWPNLDDQIREKLEEVHLNYTFNPNDKDNSYIKSYDTNIMGRFTCHNPDCEKNGWSSKKIAITIRGYSRGRYNARVYHQRCDACRSLGKPTLDEESYTDIVCYRIKKWNGFEMEQREWGGKSKGPHNKTLCEGCKHGHCKEGRVGIEWA
ncbi:zinc-binding domain-containing protein [Fusarium flagelliforme]|uniref:zinc-binding domain-containing protein n=1 Tax=Fusarium flagelliforme TaxID=2675880 RepID=UPI001E8D7973|nr:zinc-binding domain-containing protein [Fusarium flagelliforme]KAH7184635.1 zinc-binding domain-containing protein [Fusarium flagelliforme]